MEVIKTKMIQGKEAKFILEDDGTASVVYDEITLLKHIHWDSLKEDKWAHEALIDVEVNTYLESKGVQAYT